MTGWRETCDEIKAAAAKATSRPWDHVLSNGWILGGVLKDDYCNVCEQPYKPEDAAFITIAANNADRLARFAKAVAQELRISFKHVTPAEVDRHLARLWEESG